jgi:enoyl-CoA hydratase
MAYQYIIAQTTGAVGTITLNRPAVLNALSSDMMKELSDALDHLESQPKIRVILLKGSDQAFAVGADIRELKDRTYADNLADDYLADWDRLARCRLPTIAAVAGLAMGAGCELALMCDLIIAADTARFSQPEVTIGLMPGIGGTQRLPHTIGKAKAMDLCLTGRFMDAAEAERCGLVSRIVPLKDLQPEAINTAMRMSELPRSTLMLIKESVNRSFEAPLAEGLRMERRLFHSLFSLKSPHEGMDAFLNKRPAVFEE